MGAMRLRPWHVVLGGLTLVIALPAGCSSESNTDTGAGAGSNSGGSGAGTTTNAGGSGSVGGASSVGGSGGSTSTGVPPVPTSTAPCAGKIWECGDLMDNDGDGLIDSQDPDCLGPCDNTEDSLYGGIPGQNSSPCRQDCYWDDDTGPGNDDCYWSHKCDPNSVPPNYYPEPDQGSGCAYDVNANIPGTGLGCSELFMGQSQECLDTCGPLVPNGCDCFGCCEIPADSNNFVFLGSVGANGNTVCTLDKVNDPTVCHPCQQVDLENGCGNPCDPCELCVGKTTLPPECFPGEGGAGGAPPGKQCPEGIQACGLPSQPPCPNDTFCITGCCVPVPG